MGQFYSPRIVTDGLVLALDAANSKSYSGTGTTWFDLSGNNNHGILQNNPSIVSGSLGNITLDFPVGDPTEWVLIGNNEIFQVQSTDPYSMEVWFNPHGTVPLNSDSSGTACGLFQRGIFGGSYGFDMGNNAQNIQFFQRTDTGTSATPNYELPNGLNNVYHVMGVATGTDLILYINGERITSTTVQSGTLSVSEVSATRQLRIGHDRARGGGGATERAHFLGNVYSAKFYNRALTSDEVSQNYNATKSRYGI